MGRVRVGAEGARDRAHLLRGRARVGLGLGQREPVTAHTCLGVGLG